MSLSPFDPVCPPRRHLTAAVIAVSAFIALAIGSTVVGQRIERKNFSSLLPLFAELKGPADADRASASYLEHLKNQGVALQRRAFERADLLPLYGSSELVKHIPAKPNIFFRNFPTGFAVVPVGKAGTTSLIMLQKLGAVGRVVAGKRVVLSLSPSWFLRDAMSDHPYEGNFSRQQAFGTLLNPRLSFMLKRDLARRMMLRPATLDHDTLLRFLAHRIAHGEAVDRLVCRAMWPLCLLQKALYGAQDHFETSFCMIRNAGHLPEAPAHIPTQLDWDRLLAEASRQAASTPNLPVANGDPKRAGTDAAFRDAMARSREWDDLALLLRGLQEMKVRTLVLCMPPDSGSLKHSGVSPESVALLSAKLHEAGEQFGAQVETFDDHDGDVDFLSDHNDHLSAKGWMYYNRTIDEFYHADTAASDSSIAGSHRKRHPTGGTRHS